MFAGRRINIAEMLQRLEQTARSLGLHYGETLVGAQPYEQLAALLTSQRVPAQKPSHAP